MDSGKERRMPAGGSGRGRILISGGEHQTSLTRFIHPIVPVLSAGVSRMPDGDDLV
jgi:hypothetical protein